MSIPTLAMIPSGYKAKKVYSVLPTDGSGDLKFSRTTNGTRVNQNGLIETVAGDVPRLDYTDGSCPSLLLEPSSINLITQSESFANTYWNKSGASIQGDASTAGAEKATNGNFASSSDWAIVNSDSNATSAIANGYLKLKTSGIFTQASQNMSLVVGNTYKLTYEILSSDGGNLGLVNSNNITTLIPSSVGFHTIYFQPNNGTFALKRYSGALDVQIDNISIKEVSGFSAPSVDSPLSAFKLVEDTSTGSHYIATPTVSVSSGSSVTNSIFAKKGERDWIRLWSFDLTTDWSTYFNLDTGTIGTVQSGTTASMEHIGNGWYKCSITYVNNHTGALFYPYIAQADNVKTYTGDGTSGVYIFGAQVEQNSSATSYIPTSGTTISRTADSASKSGISSLIGQTEGVLYLSYKNKTTSSTEYISLSDGTDANSIRIFWNVLNQMGVSILVGGGSVYSDTVTDNYSNVTDMKVAIKYKSGDYAIFINGVRKGFSTTITSPPLTSILAANRGASAGFLYKDIKDLRVYNQILTDAELTTLTTI